jgi:MSHA pilin protein MshD
MIVHLELHIIVKQTNDGNMNTGQMIMTLGAMLLLASVMLRVNTTNLTNESVRDEAQYGVLANSIATSIIEQAQSRAFDEVTDTSNITSTSQLSSVLGPESGETEESYNDFDDFNGFTKRDSSMKSAVFDISCTVNYVEPGNILGSTSNKTYHKKITVTITRPVSADSSVLVVRSSSIFSYWYFR